MTTEPTIPELLKLTEGELYADLGAQLLGEDQAFGLEDIFRARRYAKAWLDEWKEEIAEGLQRFIGQQAHRQRGS